MLSMIRCWFLTLGLCLTISVLAQESPAPSCLGQAQDNYWQDISTILAGDQTIDHLSAYREDICHQVARGKLRLDLAHGLWERMLVNTVIVQVALQKKRAHHAVLRIYSTF